MLKFNEPAKGVKPQMFDNLNTYHVKVQCKVLEYNWIPVSI